MTEPLSGSCNVGEGKGGLPACTMTHASGSTCEISLYGAQLISFKCNGKERLFLSEKSEFQVGSKIRGGVPVCWPQFAGMGPLPHHGVAQTHDDWAIVHLGKQEDTESFSISLAMAYNEKITLTITTILHERSIEQKMEVHNDSDEEFSFTTALHTYFAADLPVVISGLENSAFTDKVKDFQNFEATKEPITVNGEEIDRIYEGTPREVKFGEMVVEKEGFPDTVVWNIGEEKAPGMKDLSSINYVCVETAFVKDPCVVKPNDSWTGSHRLRVA